jgi:hypothetical protein
MSRGPKPKDQVLGAAASLKNERASLEPAQKRIETTSIGAEHNEAIGHRHDALV